MKVLVVLGHPKPGSFNHAIADEAIASLRSNGHQVIFHDLCLEHFDPSITHEELRRGAALAPAVDEHCRQLSTSDGLVIVHPNWWGQPPAVVKGWIDRVFRVDVAYRFAVGDAGEGKPVPLLGVNTAVVFNTTDTPQEREVAEFGDPLDTIWRNCILRYCGVQSVVRKTFGVMVTSTGEQRRAWLDEVRQVVHRSFPRHA